MMSASPLVVVFDGRARPRDALPRAVAECGYPAVRAVSCGEVVRLLDKGLRPGVIVAMCEDADDVRRLESTRWHPRVARIPIVAIARGEVVLPPGSIGLHDPFTPFDLWAAIEQAQLGGEGQRRTKAA